MRGVAKARLVPRQLLQMTLGRAQGRPGSMGLVYGMLLRQSALLAYIDIFRWTALLAFFCAAAVWLFRKPPKSAKAPEGAH